MSIFLSGVSRRGVLSGMPFAVMVEPTNRCNLHCILCPTGMGDLKRKKGEMSPERMRTLVRELPGEVSLILFWGMGEPFMAKSFLIGVSEAKRRGIRTRASTNGHFLAENGTAAMVIESGLDELIVSLDGTIPETYRKYRQGGNFQRVVDGIRKLRSVRDSKRHKTPRLILQFLVTVYNEGDLNELDEFAARIGVDRVEVKTLQAAFSPEGKKYLPKNQLKSRYKISSRGIEPVKRRINWGVPCRRLWYSTVINWEGDVSPCCFDKDSQFIMGNVFEENLTEIWYGKPYRNFRDTILTKGPVFPMCRDCTEGLRRLYIR